MWDTEVPGQDIFRVAPFVGGPFGGGPSFPCPKCGTELAAEYALSTWNIMGGGGGGGGGRGEAPFGGGAFFGGSPWACVQSALP